jgi:hypothetical protein
MEQVAKHEEEQVRKEKEMVDNMRKAEDKQTQAANHDIADIIEPNFYYDEDEETVEEEEAENKGIAERVARWQGRHH